MTGHQHLPLKVMDEAENICCVVVYGALQIGKGGRRPACVCVCVCAAHVWRERARTKLFSSGAQSVAKGHQFEINLTGVPFRLQ